MAFYFSMALKILIYLAFSLRCKPKKPNRAGANINKTAGTGTLLDVQSRNVNPGRASAGIPKANDNASILSSEPPKVFKIPPDTTNEAGVIRVQIAERPAHTFAKALGCSSKTTNQS